MSETYVNDIVVDGSIKSAVELCNEFRGETLQAGASSLEFSSGRPSIVGFVKDVSNAAQTAIIRPTENGIVVVRPEVGMDIFDNDVVCSHNGSSVSGVFW